MTKLWSFLVSLAIFSQHLENSQAYVVVSPSVTTTTAASSTRAASANNHAAASLRFPRQQQQRQHSFGGSPSRSSSTCLHVLLPAAAASIVAGSIAGAIGGGAAFPFDTLKTKSQVMPRFDRSGSSSSNNNLGISSSSDELALSNTASDGTVAAVMTSSVVSRPVAASRSNSMLSVISYVLETEGVEGFFSGVKTMMLGQALIKSAAFGANALALDICQQQHIFQDEVMAQLVTAACMAGFATSFIVVPIERVKVVMQVAGQDQYFGSEWRCLNAILAKEGLPGLFGRGLWATIAREVPRYGIYFGLFGYLMRYGPWGEDSLAPLLYGALAGCACWIPVYPVDVIKTLVQNTEGGDGEDDVSSDARQVALDLYRTQGLGAFWDGLSAKMWRAAVNHSVTFFVYEWVMHMISDGTI